MSCSILCPLSLRWWLYPYGDLPFPFSSGRLLYCIFPWTQCARHTGLPPSSYQSSTCLPPPHPGNLPTPPAPGWLCPLRGKALILIESDSFGLSWETYFSVSFLKWCPISRYSARVEKTKLHKSWSISVSCHPSLLENELEVLFWWEK